MDPEHPDRPTDEEEEAHRRIALPLLIPVVGFLFAALLIYGLSRIFLELQDFKIEDVSMATPLALGVAIGILLVAWYLTSRPRVPTWQIGAIVSVSLALLVAGTIWAAVREEEGAAAPDHAGATATPPAPGEMLVTMGDNFFEFEGEREPTIQVPAGREVTLNLENTGTAIHNMHVSDADGNYADAICETGGEAFCSDPNQIPGGETGTITVQFEETGTFLFRCDFHPVEMTGTIEVVEGDEEPPPEGPPEGPPEEEPGDGPPGPPPEGEQITLGDNFFEFEGETEPSIEVPVGEEVAFSLVNEGFAVHNMHVADADGEYEESLCSTEGEAFCSDPDQMTGGETGSITVQFDEAGTFDFRCDFHPVEMTGTFVAQ